jgi:hypothetical protein
MKQDNKSVRKAISLKESALEAAGILNKGSDHLEYLRVLFLRKDRVAMQKCSKVGGSNQIEVIDEPGANTLVSRASVEKVVRVLPWIAALAVRVGDHKHFSCKVMVQVAASHA